MEKHYLLNDSEFQKQFENCSLNPSEFSHEAHLRLAWLYIKNYGIDKAGKHMTTQLQKYVNFVGAKDKYHATVTIAGLHAVHHFMKKYDCTTFAEFINVNTQLKSNFKELLNSHYKNDIFNSTFGKTQYMEPDLVPFNTVN